MRRGRKQKVLTREEKLRVRSQKEGFNSPSEVFGAEGGLESIFSEETLWGEFLGQRVPSR